MPLLEFTLPFSWELCEGIAVTQSKACSACLRVLPLQVRTLPNFHGQQFVHELMLPESSGVSLKATSQSSGNLNCETLG